MFDNFDRSLRLTLRHEGGYVNHPADPGGATNQGVTQRTYDAWRRREGLSKRDVRSIEYREVKEIYRTEYWDKVRCGDLPKGLDYVTFDASVNSGVRRGPKWTQKAIGTNADGLVGPLTIQAAYMAAKTSDMHIEAIKAACRYRVGFLRGLGHWSTFRRGWTRRVAEVEAEAIGMVARPQRIYAEANKADTKAKVHAGAGAAEVGALTGLPVVFDIPPWAVGGMAVLAAGIAFVAIRIYLVERDRAMAFVDVANNYDGYDLKEIDR